MDCRRFEASLEGLSYGLLAANERVECEAHAASCAACGELLALATLPTDVESPGLVASVIARTSGEACESIALRLPALAGLPGTEGSASASEDRELAAHVEHCGECRALVGVLAALSRELPTLAWVRPDDRFVDDVLKRTLPVQVQLRRWWMRVWPQWLHRPRFASEAAFIGLLVMVMVFATPGTPLEALPQRALSAARPASQINVGEYLVASSEETLDSLRAAGAKTAAKADEVVTGAAEKATGSLATFWREAASLLGNDGTDAASQSPESPDSNEESP